MDGTDLAPREFLGVGWAWPVEPAEDGEIALARYEESVRQSVWIILGTSPGERVMRPDFGCAIHDLVFAPNSAATLGMAEHHVRDALLRWEPRIEVLDVGFDLDRAGHGELVIEIAYRLRATNHLRNLVHPFYVIPAEEAAE